MPKQFGTWISELADIAGYDKSKLVDLLSVNAQIPDDLVSQISSSLMTLDTAKNNPDLKKYFHAQALNGIDAELRNVLSEIELPDEEKQGIESETSTYKKVSKSLRTIAALKDAKANANTKAEKNELQKEIDRLNDEVKQAKGLLTQKEQEYNQKLDSTLTQYQIDNILAGKNYAFADLPKEVVTQTAKTLLNSTLSQKGLQIVRDNDKLKLVRADAPDLDYRENNTPIHVADFVDRVLAENKMLKVSEAQPNTPVANPTTVTPPQANSAYESALQANAAALEAAGVKF